MDKAKVAIAKKQMARIPVMYEQLMRMHPDGLPSLGMVARYDRIGSGSVSNSSTVESVAMKDLTLTEAQREMIHWLDCVTDVHTKLIETKGKNGPKQTHEKLLANVLKGRVFDSMTFGKIKQLYFRENISEQYVRKLYDDCVEKVAVEAEKRGLYKASA